jgi:hypothetical protein
VASPCPWDDGATTFNATHFNLQHHLTRDIPEILREIYSSGTVGWPNTVVNYFDIESRQYSTSVSELYNNGSAFLVTDYRPMGTLITKDEIVLVEGLLIDLKDDGVGFRNHTLPTGVGVGGSWEEDILFIQPETVCVDTNLSLAFTIHKRNRENTVTPVSFPFSHRRVTRPALQIVPLSLHKAKSITEPNFLYIVDDVRLVDNGGFSNLNRVSLSEFVSQLLVISVN